MSAAARAKARREAILGARGDRLAKLTSSARGEDPEGIYAQAPGSSLKNFVGEETTLPTPPPASPKPQHRQPSPSPSPQPQRQNAAEIPPMPEWGPEQQQLFRALLSGAAPGSIPGAPPSLTGTGGPSPQVPEDPFSALAAALSGFQDGGAFVPPAPAAPPKPKSFLQKIIPLLHALSMIGLLLWFVGFMEPQAYEASPLVHAEIVGRKSPNQWGRWATLAKGRPDPAGIVIAQLPNFFWAFTTIELILHSLRLFTGANDYKPPFLLQLALPYLPPPLPQAISTSLKYLQMVGLLLDDISILLFGFSVIIFVSNWTT